MKSVLLIVGCLIVGSVQSQNIVNAEYFIDSDPGFGKGSSISVTAGSDVTLNFSPNLSSLAGGFHTLYVRGRDVNGKWSGTAPFAFYKAPSLSGSSFNIIAGEYFIDKDPGFGLATPVPGIVSGTDVTPSPFRVDLDALAGGFHTLYVRAMDANGAWSTIHARAFYKSPSISNPGTQIIAAEFFIDNDPGFGQATLVPAFTQGANVNIAPFAIDLQQIAGGFHTLYLRAMDGNGKWSNLQARAFFKSHNVVASIPQLTAAEYFIDKDPGFGSGTAIPVTPGNSVTADFLVDISGLNGGFHTLYIRGKDNLGQWSVIRSHAFLKPHNPASTAAPVSSIEYFFYKAGQASPTRSFVSFVPSNDVTVTFSPLTLGLDIDSTYTMHTFAVDSLGKRSLAAIADIVAPLHANHAPVVTKSLADTSLLEDFGSRTIADLRSVFADPDSLYLDSLRYGVQVSSGIISAQMVGSVLQINSVLNINGSDQIIVTATDKSNASVSDTFSVFVAAVNDPPVAQDDQFVVTSGQPSSLQVLNNDSDVDGPSLSIQSILSLPLHGNATVTGGTVVTYTSSFAYVGPDQFSYVVSDGAGGTDTAQVTLTVQAPAALTVSTSVHQNPAISKYADVYVVPDTSLLAAPSVKLFAAGDSSAVTMSALTSNVYKGNIQFTQSAAYTIRTQATSVTGSFFSAARSYNVVLSKAELPLVLSSIDKKAVFSAKAGAIQSEAYLLASQESDGNSQVYEFTSVTELRKTAEISFSYDVVADESKLRIYHDVDGVWMPLRTRVYPAEARAVATTDDFGRYKLMYDEAFEGNNIVPSEFVLSQNYPNPFNPTTTIKLDLADEGPATLAIYNILGQRVRTLMSGTQQPGNYTVVWDGRNDNGVRVGSGIYFYRLEAVGFTKTRKMILLK